MSVWNPGIRKWFTSRTRKSVNRFDVRVLCPPAKRFEPTDMPFELRFVFRQFPECADRVRALFERGYGIGIRTVLRTSEDVLDAVARISEGSYHGVLEPWLTHLIFSEEVPVFTEDELYEQNQRGVNLYTEAHVILSERFLMKRLVLIDLESHGIQESDQEFISSMNRVLEPLSAAYLHHRIHADRRTFAFRLSRTLLSALFIIGPITHALEHWVRGIGRMFAALADDVTRESAELVTLKGSGYTGRQIWRRAQVFVPVLVVVIWLVLQVECLVERGSLFLAGLTFGLVAVSFTFVRILQTYARLRTAYVELEQSSKLPSGLRLKLSSFALREIRWSPQRFGLLIGACAAPVLSGVCFAMLSSFLHNGWFLALIASLEVFIASAYVGNVRIFDRALFIRTVRRRIEKGRKV